MAEALTANILIYILWIWLVNQITPLFRHGKRVIILSILYTGVGAIVMRAMPHLISADIFQNMHQTTFILVTIICLTGAALTLINHPKHYRSNLRYSCLYFGIIYIAAILILSQITNLHRQKIGLFFVNIAIIEEWIKHIVSYRNHHDYSINHADIIVFSIMAALSFAWRENILVATQITHVLARFPVYTIHIIFTSMVSVAIYGYFRHELSRNIMLAGMAIAITGHTAYNILHTYIHRPILAGITIITYGIISYGLYRSDSLYIKTNTTTCNTCDG